MIDEADPVPQWSRQPTGMGLRASVA